VPRRKLTFRPLAEEDLTQLYLYIAEQSGYPERAIDYVRRLRDFCESLVAFPKRGLQRNDLRPGLWVAGFEKRVAIAYMIQANGDVEIGRVFYGGRDYETLLHESGEE
jgi:plasmid stabilization system protein ParE